MREVEIEGARSEAASFAACIATILELPMSGVPIARTGEPTVGWRTTRWLGELGLGLVPVADAPGFHFAGPWIGWYRRGDDRRAVVMYGSPAGVVWDPAGALGDGWTLDGGHVIAALDIALARPVQAEAPTTQGAIESIWIAPSAGAPARALTEARALAGVGLDGDRHVLGTGTFPSRLPGSALTLIEAEVCDSFTPALGPDEHRRNVVTRGIDLTRLLGRELWIGTIRCRGLRLCEPCRVIQGYSKRAILRRSSIAAACAPTSSRMA
jgi:hypothetical protein